MKIKFRLLLTMLFITSYWQSIKAQEKDTSRKEVIFEAVQVAATFPGGTKGWIEYLSTNLKSELGAKYIDIPKGEKKASQKVMVTFLIDKEGNVVEAIVENMDGVHPKLAEEAKRVILLSPKWQPAKQNGRYVSFRNRQVITFVNEK